MQANGAGVALAAYRDRLAEIMPPQSSVKPGAQDYLDVIAFLASTSGAKTGATMATLGAGAWREARLPAGAVLAQTKPEGGDTKDWTYWRGGPDALAYADADQINAGNVGKLEIAWRWSGGNYGPTPEARSITTPVMADGVVYATAGVTRNVVALDAATGETLWMYRPTETKARFENAPRKGAGRGVALWKSGHETRIFTVTPGFHLVSLDAKSGQPIRGFGENGVIDLMMGLRNAPAEGLADIGSQSPPLIIGDIVVVGPAHLISFRPKAEGNVKGDVRAFDVRTGRQVWRWSAFPDKGEPGYETWEPGGAEKAGNGGVWAPMSADLETGAIFLPVESGTSDLYGGARKGANKHTSSLVSLDAKTGKVRWAQQLVHHDIWDWDVPATPILTDIPTTTGVRHAVAQITKQGFVFVFDRNTGEPLWPIEERAVPKSDVPGEETYPTQPMPTLPKPFDRQGVTPDDLVDFTPELKAKALAVAKPYRFGPLYAPPSLDKAADGTRGVLRLPGALGGANWESGAYDPATGMLYVASMTQLEVMAVTDAPPGSPVPYFAAYPRRLEVDGIPLAKPPWGRITAIDLTTGQHAWMMANADTPEAIRNHPALKGIDLPRTGIATRAGLLATPTLLFAGEGAGGSPVLRAHDKATGKILAEIRLPGSQTGLPMSYVWNGKQYVVMSVSDGTTAAEIVALALPK
jgi:quinoprotein glucose dehydrogenase